MMCKRLRIGSYLPEKVPFGAIYRVQNMFFNKKSAKNVKRLLTGFTDRDYDLFETIRRNRFQVNYGFSKSIYIKVD